MYLHDRKATSASDLLVRMHLRRDSPEEISLLGLAEIADSHVWQHLFLQNLFGVFDSSFLSHARFCSSGTNKVQSHILFLNYKSFIQRWLHLETQRQHRSHDSHMAGRSRAMNERLAKNQDKH